MTSSCPLSVYLSGSLRLPAPSTEKLRQYGGPHRQCPAEIKIQDEPGVQCPRGSQTTILHSKIAATWFFLAHLQCMLTAVHIAFDRHHCCGDTQLRGWPRLIRRRPLVIISVSSTFGGLTMKAGLVWVVIAVARRRNNDLPEQETSVAMSGASDGVSPSGAHSNMLTLLCPGT